MAEKSGAAQSVAWPALVEKQVLEGEHIAAVWPEVQGGVHQARLPQTWEVGYGRLTGPKAKQQ